MNISRRHLLAAIPAVSLAACSQQQLDSALVKIKEISASTTTRVVGWFDGIELAAGLIKKIQESDARIQAATTLGEVLREAVRNLSHALDGLLALGGIAPVPAVVITAMKTINGALRAFLGIAGAAPGERQPSLDDALAAARAIPVRR